MAIKHTQHTILALIVATTLLLSSVVQPVSSLHSITRVSRGTGREDMECPDDNMVKILAIRFKVHAGMRIAFNLADYSSNPPEREFITKDSDGQKRYGEFNLGSTCYMHANYNAENIHPFFAVVMQRRTNVAGTKHCKIVKLITSKGFEACSGATRDLWSELVKPEWRPGTATIDGFNRLKMETENQISSFLGKVYTLENFALSDIDDQIMEMMVLGGLENPNIYDPILQVDYTIFTSINANLDKNSFATEINPANMVPRLVRDNIPGYYLEPYTSGGSDETEKYAQIRFRDGDATGSVSVHTEFYIEKPNLILTGETHSVTVVYKSWVASSSSADKKLKESEYKISVSRVGVNLNFKVYQVDGGTDTQRITLDYADSGSNTGYLYFSLTVGRGVLYYIDATNVRVKAYETLNVCRVGESRGQASSNYQEDSTLDSLYKITSSETGERYGRVEFKPTAPLASNKAGFRLLVFSQAQGVVPGFLVSSFTNEPTRPRCYFDAYGPNQCISLALLSGPGEAQAPLVRSQHKVEPLSSSSDSNIKTNCKVALSKTYCLIPKPGFVTNLETWKKISIYKRLLPVAEYEALTADEKKQAAEYQNNVGTKYFASCDYSCNFEFLSFSLFFLFCVVQDFSSAPAHYWEF